MGSKCHEFVLLAQLIVLYLAKGQPTVVLTTRRSGLITNYIEAN